MCFVCPDVAILNGSMILDNTSGDAAGIDVLGSSSGQGTMVQIANSTFGNNVARMRSMNLIPEGPFACRVVP